VVKWSKITIWGTSKIDSWWYPGLVKKICRYTFFYFWLWIFSLFAHVHFGKDFRNPYQNGMVKNWKNPKSKIEKVLKKYFFYWLGILSGIDFWGPSDSDFLNILIFDFGFFSTFRPLHLVGISEILTKMDMCKKWKNLKSKIKKCVPTDFFYEPGIPSGIDFWCPPDSDFWPFHNEIFLKKKSTFSGAHDVSQWGPGTVILLSPCTNPIESSAVWCSVELQTEICVLASKMMSHTYLMTSSDSRTV